jgi:hypothetical protein
LKADGSPDESFRFGELCEPADLEEHYVPRLIAILPDGSMLVHMHNERHQKDETVYLDRDGKEVRTLGPPYSVLRTRPGGRRSHERWRDPARRGRTGPRGSGRMAHSIAVFMRHTTT